MGNRYFFVFTALLLLASTVAALVPSEKALETAAPYRRSGEEATVINRPYVVDARSYWVVYFHPQTSPEAKNAIIAIDADTGELVTNEPTLRKVYTFDFKLNFLQNFLAEKKLSFTDLRASLDSSKTKRDQAEVTLDNLQRTVERDGKDITTVQTAFSSFTVQAERLNDNVDAGIETESLFDREYSSVALEALLSGYSNAYSTLLSFIREGNTYQQAVINKSNQFTQEGYDQNKFKPQLQSAYDVGLDKFPLLATLQSAVGEFNSLNSTQNQRLVNDSIQSYLYRKGKVDSDAAVESIRAKVENVLNRKAEISECTGTSRLESDWNNVLASQRAGSFGAVQGNVTLAGAELDKIKREFDTCSGSATEQQPPARSDNTNLYVVGVIVLLVAYLAYAYYKRRKASAEADESSSGKGSLFGR